MGKLKLSPFVKQCFVTGAVCGNIIGHGCCIGFPAILLPQLQQPGSEITPTPGEASWIASILGFSLLIGNFVTPPISEKWGRRVAHYACTLPVIVGWFTCILATNVQELIIGRFLQGLSYGMLLPLRSLLIGEYTSPGNRGAFLTLVALAQAFGIFFVHLMGSLISWQWTSLICVGFSFASLIMTMFSPESPSFLAATGKYNECRKAFKWLRGDDEDEELEEMIQACMLMEKDKIAHKPKTGLREIIETTKKKEFYKPIIIMAHAYCMVQFTGGTTMANYSTQIIRLIVGPDANAHFWMVALDTQRIISNAAAVYVINRTKRRTMLFATGGLCVLSHFAISAYVYSKQQSLLSYDASWIPILLINLQFFTVAVGMVPMPGVIAGEVFPLEYRNSGGCISVVSLAMCMFVALKTFPFLIENLGLHGTYFLYGAFTFYNLVVMWFMLPETKGRTLQQIEDEFRGGPLKPEEMEARMSLQANPVEAYKRKVSLRRDSTPLVV